MKFKLFLENIEQHLKDRDVIPYNPKYPVYMDTEEDVAYFPLFNLSGQFVGYQRYNPKGLKWSGTANKELIKKAGNDEKKYYTYVGKENPDKKVRKTALYGLHTLDKRPYVFIVEGIFDAVKLIRLNQPVVAVLANDPKPLKNFFFVLQKHTIAIEDNDEAGSKLKNIAKMAYTVPAPYKDLGDMSLDEVKKFLKTMKGVKV